MPQITGQTVAQIQHAARDAAQTLSKRHARRWPLQTRLRQCHINQISCRSLLAQHIQRIRRRTQLAGDVNAVPHACAAACDRLTRRHLTKHRHIDDQNRTACGIAADERTLKPLGQSEQALGESRQPRLVHARQANRQRKANRICAHCGQIGQIHRQSLVPKRTGCDIGEKMPPFDQHIAGDHALIPLAHAKQRGVVANAQIHLSRAV